MERIQTLFYSKVKSTTDKSFGIAYIFNAQCAQVPFHVKGPVLDNGGKIVLTGQAPHVGRNCQTTGEYTSTLEFKLLKIGSNSSALCDGAGAKR